MDAAQSTRRSVGGTRATPWLLAAGLMLQAVLFTLSYRTHAGALLDDAYISFRYAARWASGLGWTWNDGVPLEGFSNPLWTASLGVITRTLAIPPHVIAPILGLLCLLLLTPLMWALARSRGFGPLGTAVLVLITAGDVGLALWAGSGLETVSCALLVAAGLLAASRVSQRPTLAAGTLLGCFAALQVTSRPEGVLWALVSLAWLVWGAWAPWRTLVGWALGFLPAVGFFAFRWVTFHRLVPNTFFAKVETDPGAAVHGLTAAGEWLALYGVLLVAAGVALVRAHRRPTSREVPGPRWWLYPLGLLVLQMSFFVAVGGDWMGVTRYMSAVIPCVAVLTALTVDRLESRGALRVICTVLIVAHLGVGWWGRDVIPTYTREGRELGLWLKSVAVPGDRIAVTAAGAIPYFSELPTYDVLGINDPDVAGRPVRHQGEWTPGHHRYDLDRLLEVAPQWIVWDFSVQLNRNRMRRLRPGLVESGSLDFRSGLLAKEAFRAMYTVDTSTPAATQSAYTVFRRR